MINEWRATLSVNAGLSLRTQDLCIWVDAIHTEQTHDFSTLSPEHQRFLFASDDFADPDVIFFTHTHPDHYSWKLCEKAREMYPGAKLALPEQKHDGQILLSGRESILTVKNRLLTFRRIVHEGEEFREVPHYCMMAEDDGESILVLGDSAIAGADLKEWTEGRIIDTVIAPFPWITLNRGRNFLQEVLKPSHLLIYHLPLPEDDKYGYIKAARKAALKMNDDIDIRLFTDAFQTEEF